MSPLLCVAVCFLVPVPAPVPVSVPVSVLFSVPVPVPVPVPPVQAQTPRPEDVASIDGIIRAYYEVVSGPAGGVVDVERDRSLHHPNAWVAIAGSDSAGKPRVRVMRLADYHGSNAPRREGFYEWETAREVRRSGNMVHVWSSYATARTPGGEPYARGVNSITLFHDGQRWWIMGWMFDSSAP